MYERFHGLDRKPFSLLPDADFLYLGRRHRTAFSLLQYGVQEGLGFVVITGEIGAGKTTLIHRLLGTMGGDVRSGLITHTHAAYGSVIRSVASAFELECTGDNQVIYNGFRDFLGVCEREGRRAVLIIDEAQNLSIGALEELRMLSNLNLGSKLVLQIILSGQPQLLENLRKPELEQFVQRIGINYHLKELDLADTIDYIRHRLGVAGGRPELFDDLACAAAYVYSGGIPRLINVLCDLALVYSYAENRHQIDYEVIADVAESRESGGLSPFRGELSGKSRDQIRDILWRRLDAIAPDSLAKASRQA